MDRVPVRTGYNLELFDANESYNNELVGETTKCNREMPLGINHLGTLMTALLHL